MPKSNEANKRTRNWTFIVYPDSAPENWIDLLKDQHVEGFVSPIHDKDVNPGGEPKKPHYHVMLMFQGVKTEKQAQEISDMCSGVQVQMIKNVRGEARYLCHLDNPEKEQYDRQGVISLAGADYLDKIGGYADTDTAVGEMMDWCIDQGCFSFFHLSNYARNNRPDWFRVLTSQRTVFLTSWLKSMKWEIDQGTFTP